MFTSVLRFVAIAYLVGNTVAQAQDTSAVALPTPLPTPVQTSTSVSAYALKNSSPASPNAAALGKYADLPVNFNTGLPNISIPITTIKDGDLSLPISLDYHGGGIRVSEVASWVGIGWSLSAGGVISRQVNGGPDESYASSNTSNKGVLPGVPAFTVLGSPTVISGYYADYGFRRLPIFVYQPPGVGDLSAGYAKQSEFVSAAIGLKDTEPDIFTFNVAGVAGKFFFDTLRQAHFLPEQDIKLEVDFDETNYEFRTFVLTTNDGNRYHFGGTAYERSLSGTGEQVFGSTYLKSSWQLFRVESADRQHIINLEYVDEGNKTLNLKSEDYKISNNTPIIADPYQGGFTTASVVESKRLRRIYSRSMEAILEANTVRQDVSLTNLAGYNSAVLSPPKRLDSIIVRGATDVGSCLTFKLSYDYMEAPLPIEGSFARLSWNEPPVDQSDKKRLRLLAVQEKSCDGTLAKPPYTFEYDPTPLPRRLSYEVDHWGYYNGQVYNKSFVVDNQINPKPNRDADWTYMKAGHLTKIKYPTGGSIHFVFEPHYATAYSQMGVYYGGLRIKQITENFGEQQTTRAFSYSTPRQPYVEKQSVYRKTFRANSDAEAYYTGYTPQNFSEPTAPAFFYYTCTFGQPMGTLAFRIGSSLYGQVEGFMGSQITYPVMSVRTLGNGRTEYAYLSQEPRRYHSSTDYPVIVDLKDYVVTGKLIRQTTFSEAGAKVKETTWEYTPQPYTPVQYVAPAVRLQLQSPCVTPNPLPNTPDTKAEEILVNNYALSIVKILLLNKTDKNYDVDGGSEVVSTETYTYGDKHQSPIETKSDRSDGSFGIVKQKYVLDYFMNPLSSYTGANDVLYQMAKANINAPIEEVRFSLQDTQLNCVGAMLTEYQTFGTYLHKPQTVYSLALTRPLADFQFSTWNNGSFNKDGRYEARLIYNYNAQGKLETEQQVGGSPTKYLYGANGLLSSKTEAFGSGVAQTTTFVQDELFGPKAITSPNGITTFYDYDALGRLVKVRNTAGQTLKTYHYQYKVGN
jgi:YD repeat-containing protein